jgi:Gpi18-like mannosyltransferase
MDQSTRLKDLSIRHAWIIFVLMFLFYAAVMPTSGLPSDVWYWRTWARFIHEYGLANIYQSNTDYLPLYHYILWVFGKIQGTALAIENHLVNLKLITLLFDFGSAIILFTLLKQRSNNFHALALTMLFLLNIAYFFNTMIWFQVDSILAFFVLAAIYAAHSGRTVLAIVLFVLALNFKLQAIVFLPVIGLVLMPHMARSFSIRNLVLAVTAVVLLQALILLPFYLEGDLDRVWSVVTNATGRYPVISANAYNLWALFFNQMWVSDAGYRGIGLLLFFLFSLLALWPLLRKLVGAMMRSTELRFELEEVLLAGALCGMSFFYFNTQMHERYAHPALLLVAGYALLSRRFLAYAVLSIAYFLNMDQVMDHFRIKWLPYDPHFTSIIYLIGLALLFMDLYRVNFRRPLSATHNPNSSL